MKKLTQIFIITAVALLGYGFNAAHADACTDYYSCQAAYLSHYGVFNQTPTGYQSNPLSWVPTPNPLSWTPSTPNIIPNQYGTTYGQPVVQTAPVYYYQNTTNNTQLNQNTYNVYNPYQTVVPVTYAPTQQYNYPVTTPYYPVTTNPYYPTTNTNPSNLGTLIPDPNSNTNVNNNGNLGTLIPDPSNGTGTNTNTNNGNVW